MMQILFMLSILKNLVLPAMAEQDIGRIDRVQAKCQQFLTTGFKEYKKAKMLKFSPPNNQYKFYLPVVFHVINHNGGIFSSKGFSISEGELKVHLEGARSAFNGCGIEVVLNEVHYWDVPDFLNMDIRSRINQHYIGWEEKCLIAPIHRNNMINVYFVDGVIDPLGVGRSHAIAPYWFQAEEPGDERFIGAAFITDFDRKESSSRYTVVAHEMGHPVMNVAHTGGGEYNFMSDRRENMTFHLTQEQCLRAKTGKFVRQK